MRILNDVSDYAGAGLRAPLSLALGNFDGLHLGHQELLKKVVTSARSAGGTAAVFTFLDHPQQVLNPESKKMELLTSLDHRLYLIEKAGIDLCFLIRFTPEFSQIEPEDFVRSFLVEKLKVKEVYLGHNARFGRARKGDSDLMARLGLELGFHYEEQKPVCSEGDVVSSSRVRKLVLEGNLEKASVYLNRPFSVLGPVVRGAGRGAGIGFPTANISLKDQILPPLGVYPVELKRVKLKKAPPHKGEGQVFHAEAGEKLYGVLNYGKRPTFYSEAAQAVLEVFILDFNENVYGETFEILFYPRLREEAAFASVETLKHQIQRDVEMARSFFQSLPADTK